VLAAGQTACGSACTKNARNFFGPQCGYRSRNATITSAVEAGTAFG
jgi:hypothetical protein